MRVNSENVLSVLVELGEDPSADRAEQICKKIETTSGALRRRAAPWADQFRPGEPGHCVPEDATWVMCEYPLAMFGDAAEWVKWFDSEVAMWAEDGDAHRFDDMLLEPIIEPIVGIERGAQAFVWDGNHRLGASFKRGLSHIKAIVGMPVIDMTVGVDGRVLFMAAVQAARVLDAQALEGGTGCPSILPSTRPAWPRQLVNAKAIAAHVSSLSPYEVSEELIEDVYRDCRAVLKWVALDSLVVSNPDGHVAEKDRQLACGALPQETMPPLLSDADGLQDGHHRLRTMKGRGVTHWWTYVIEPSREPEYSFDT